MTDSQLCHFLKNLLYVLSRLVRCVEERRTIRIGHILYRSDIHDRLPRVVSRIHHQHDGDVGQAKVLRSGFWANITELPGKRPLELTTGPRPSALGFATRSWLGAFGPVNNAPLGGRATVRPDQRGFS